MRQLTGNMANVVRGMDKAMETMNLDRISLVMDKFESQFADLDVQTSYMEDTISNTTAVTMPQDQVDLLMQQMADEAKVELQQNLESELPEQVIAKEKVVQEDDNLAERLRALRPAT